MTKLLLTALASAAVGIGATYATVHVTATCELAQTARSDRPDPLSHFFDAPLPSATGGPRY